MFSPIALCLPFVLMKGLGLGPAWPCTQAAFFLPGCTQAITSSNQLVSSVSLAFLEGSRECAFVSKLSAGLLSGLGWGKVGAPMPVQGMVFMGTSVLRGLDMGGWGDMSGVLLSSLVLHPQK